MTVAEFEHECADELRTSATPGPSGGLTEDAIALTFAARQAQRLRYIPARATWLRWDGTV